MKIDIRRSLRHFAFFVASLAAFAAQAAYDYTTFNYPGADYTQFWGINNAGKIIGEAGFADGSIINFVYNLKTGTYTNLAAPPAGFNAIGINDQGTTVGMTWVDPTAGPDLGTIRDKKGNYRYVAHPNWGSTYFRAINEAGFISGFGYDGAQWQGFVYDSKSGTFEDFLPSEQTIAHGVNSRGEAVGSTVSSGDFYGFARSAGGGLTLFQVNARPTLARGINDAGQIAGFFERASDGGVSTFVSSSTGASYEVLDVPGAYYTQAEGINNAGVVVGIVDGGSGFIAVPVKGKP